mmetsp:Transcript_25982/g.77007  ORF Transcript_25982/g.77007 Transcript_25982/m.77007 type:complete len:222 (+) Transcript_25982:353-1018(+)
MGVPLRRAPHLSAQHGRWLHQNKAPCTRLLLAPASPSGVPPRNARRPPVVGVLEDLVELVQRARLLLARHRRQEEAGLDEVLLRAGQTRREEQVNLKHHVPAAAAARHRHALTRDTRAVARLDNVRHGHRQHTVVERWNLDGGAAQRLIQRQRHLVHKVSAAPHKARVRQRLEDKDDGAGALGWRLVALAVKHKARATRQPWLDVDRECARLLGVLAALCE